MNTPANKPVSEEELGAIEARRANALDPLGHHSQVQHRLLQYVILVDEDIPRLVGEVKRLQTELATAQTRAGKAEQESDKLCHTTTTSLIADMLSWQIRAKRAEVALAKAEVALSNSERVLQGCRHELQEVEQTLGRALGYPWYKDDQQNFPGATEADGVCVGDSTPASLATEASNRLQQAEASLAALQSALDAARKDWVRKLEDILLVLNKLEGDRT